MRLAVIVFIQVGLGWSQVSSTPATGVPGTLAGTIQGSDGRVIGAGSVTLAWLTPPPNSRAPQFLRQDIPSSGSFSFAGLASGTYRLCVQTDDAMWLNPCEWGSASTSFSVSASQPVPLVTLVLQQGAVVPIRVDDPVQALALNDGKAPGAQLMLGVFNDNFQFHRSPIVSSDALGRNQQVVIPYGRTVNLFVSGSFFSITNASTGLAVPKAPTGLPLLVPLGATPAAVHLVIAGVSP
jgi:hypothetical protein